jgi:outer membrane murein-binding lipoprotein Lpp
MTQLYVFAALALTILVGGLGSCNIIQRERAKVITVQNENATLKGNVTALEKKIEVDKTVSANDAARASADVKRITTFKEKSRATIKGTKNPDHVALDADATQRVRDIFAQH